MTIQYIPEELNEQILIWVKNDKVTIFNCALVCKAWYKLAIRLYYETLLLSGNMNMWLDTIKEKAVNGIWVKKLIAAKENSVLTKEQYDDMLSYFPNLIEIDIQKSSWSHYFHLARLTGRDKSYPIRLQNIIVQTEHMTKREYQRYYICAYSFRESLRHLQLTYINKGTYIFNNQPGNLLYHLKDFCRITHLTVNNTENQYGYRDLKIIPILELFPNLVNFSMETDYNEPRSYTYQKQISAPIENTCQYLKYFSLKTPTISEWNLLYFIKFFPQIMRTLNLHVTNTSMIQLFQSVNKNVLERFGQYLRDHVDDYCFEIYSSSDDTTTNEVTTSNIPTVEDVMDSYWSFINSLRGKQHYHISVTVIDQDQSNLGFKIIKNSKSMSLYYKLIADDIIAKLTTTPTEQQKAIYSVISAHFNKENAIKSISIYDYEHNFMDGGLSLALLESIVEVYKSDLELVLMSWNNDKEIGPQLLVFGGSSTKKQPFFEALTKRIQVLDHQHLTPQPSLSTIDMMTCGLIKGERLDKNYLRTVFTILPNLTSLKLIRCLIMDKMNEQQPNQYLLDVKHNRNLNYLLLDVALFIMDYLAIEVEYTTNTANKTVIYEWERTIYTMNPRKLIGEGFKLTSSEIVKSRLKCDPSGSKTIHIRCYNVEQIDIAIMDEIVVLSIHQINNK